LLTLAMLGQFSIGATYRWNAEDELDTLPLELPKRAL
jgi:hypothetical protein